MSDKLNIIENRFAQAESVADLDAAMVDEIRALGFTYFDAFSLAVEKLADLSKACRFYSCSYLDGDPWRYVPKKIPQSDAVIQAMQLRHLPFDYVSFVKAAPATPSILLHRSILKLWNVSHAWVIPVNTPRFVQTVTTYMIRGSDATFQSMRTPAMLAANAYMNRRIELYLQEETDERVGIQLTSQEAACLIAITNGCKSDEIAHRLGVSTHTVKYHLKKLFKKLGVTSRTEAAVVGLRLGYGLEDSP